MTSLLRLSIVLGLATLASTGLAARNKCTVNRCQPAMKMRCGGLHGKARRQCRKSIVAACRGGECSCAGGKESSCAIILSPTTTVPNTTTTVPTTMTTVPTTSTTVVVGLQAPGAGLQSQITGATVSASGTVVVTFTLTDGDGNPVKPVTTATSDPAQAQVRFTIARLELDAETYNGFTTTFTRYENYTTPRPGYDSGGTLATLDPVAGTYTYTFATTLPAGFPAGLTHTVGGQVTRTFDGAMLVANPVFDFVPAGGPVTTVREDTTTAQCNGCHDPLEAHGGTRQEVHLCQLCHTEQLVDANGNSAEFQNMIHRLHRGQDLPTIVNAADGAQ